MKSITKGLLISAVVTASGAAFVAPSVSAQTGPTTYTAQLQPINNSGGTGVTPCSL